VRRRDAVHASHQTSRVQKLRTIRNPTGAYGAKRKATTSGRGRRRADKAEERIPKMVAQQQEKIGNLCKFFSGLVANAIKAKRSHSIMQDEKHGGST